MTVFLGMWGHIVKEINTMRDSLHTHESSWFFAGRLKKYKLVVLNLIPTETLVPI